MTTPNCNYCGTPIHDDSGITCQCDESRLAQLGEIATILDTAGIPCHDNQAVRVSELALRARYWQDRVGDIEERRRVTNSNSPYSRFEQQDGVPQIEWHDVFVDERGL